MEVQAMKRNAIAYVIMVSVMAVALSVTTVLPLVAPIIWTCRQPDRPWGAAWALWDADPTNPNGGPGTSQVFVLDLDIQPRARLIAIATHGRGIWVMDAAPLAGRRR